MPPLATRQRWRGGGRLRRRRRQRAMSQQGPRVERPQKQYLPPFEMPLPEPQPVDPGPPYRFYQWQVGRGVCMGGGGC